MAYGFMLKGIVGEAGKSLGFFSFKKGRFKRLVLCNEHLTVSLRLIDRTVGKHKMKRRLQRLILLTITAMLSCSIAQAKQTNIVCFLVDDLGWSDVGSFGSEFYETPNIDQLAQDGVKFTIAYAAKPTEDL